MDLVCFGFLLWLIISTNLTVTLKKTFKNELNQKLVLEIPVMLQLQIPGVETTRLYSKISLGWSIEATHRSDHHSSNYIEMIFSLSDEMLSHFSMFFFRLLMFGLLISKQILWKN